MSTVLLAFAVLDHNGPIAQSTMKSCKGGGPSRLPSSKSLCYYIDKDI